MNYTPFIKFMPSPVYVVESIRGSNSWMRSLTLTLRNSKTHVGRRSESGEPSSWRSVQPSPPRPGKFHPRRAKYLAENLENEFLSTTERMPLAERSSVCIPNDKEALEDCGLKHIWKLLDHNLWRGGLGTARYSYP